MYLCKLCFIEAWSVTEELLTNFRMPFIRRSGEYGVEFMTCAFQEGGKAEIFMVIERVGRAHLQSQLEKCGARQVVIHSFPSDDPNHLTGKFLDRVLKRADAPGMLSYQRGYCNNTFRINYDDGGYEELKQVQRMQEEEAGDADEVLLSLTCQLSNLHHIAII